MTPAPLHKLAKRWAKEVVRLNALPVPPFLQQKKDDLIQRAMTIKSALEKSDYVAPVATELGFIPLLVMGGMAAAAAMTKWISDAKQVSDMANQSQTDADAVAKLVKTGLTQQQAVDVILGKKGIDWKKWMMVGGVGLSVAGILWFFFGRKKRA